jgi:hypothetical protein
MNPLEQAAPKEGEFEINAGFRIHPVFLRAGQGRAAPRGHYSCVYERLTIIRKDCESAGGHRELAQNAPMEKRAWP